MNEQWNSIDAVRENMLGNNVLLEDKRKIKTICEFHMTILEEVYEATLK